MRRTEVEGEGSKNTELGEEEGEGSKNTELGEEEGERSKNTELGEEEGGTEAVVNTAGSVFWGVFYAFFLVKKKKWRKKATCKHKRLKRENAVRERLGVEQ